MGQMKPVSSQFVDLEPAEDRFLTDAGGIALFPIGQREISDFNSHWWWLRTELDRLFLKGPESKYFFTLWATWRLAPTLLCHCGIKTATDDSKHGCVPVKRRYKKRWWVRSGPLAVVCRSLS